MNSHKRVRRKIQKISGSYYINIPKDWMEYRKVPDTEELEIAILNDGSLRISPKSEFIPDNSEEEVILAPERYVARQIIRKCLAGAKIITVQSKEPLADEIRADIYRFVKILPLAEIMDETENKMVIHNFEYTSTNTKQAVRRMHQHICKILGNLLEGNIENLQDYISDVDRLFIIVIMHIRRYLTQEIYSGSTIDQDFTPIEALDIRMLVENIQRISKLINLILDLYDYYQVKPFVLDPRVKDFGKKVWSMFDRAMRCFFNGDSDAACEVWELNYKLVDEARPLLKGLGTELDRLIVVNFLRIADYSKRISDLVP